MSEETRIICMLYHEGWSLKKIAAHTGQNVQEVRATLVEAGVTIRPRGRPQVR